MSSNNHMAFLQAGGISQLSNVIISVKPPKGAIFGENKLFHPMTIISMIVVDGSVYSEERRIYRHPVCKIIESNPPLTWGFTTHLDHVDHPEYVDHYQSFSLRGTCL